ncbi:MAG: hypothetical protein JZU53_15590 [Paludibacter sp.]|nr:hypothetical protein [Paludibacter sp.]
MKLLLQFNPVFLLLIIASFVSCSNGSKKETLFVPVLSNEECNYSSNGAEVFLLCKTREVYLANNY